MNVKDLIKAYIRGDIVLETREYPGMENCNLVYSKHCGWILFKIKEDTISWVLVKLDGQFNTIDID